MSTHQVLLADTLSRRDQSCIWHPFTQHATMPEPVAIVRGCGAALYDEAGNEYLDAIASWWTNLHGHAHPYIARRLAEQAERLEHVIFAGFTHAPAVELAERLLGYAPGMSRVFYSDNGSTATEIAVKMCFQYWYNRGAEHRNKIIAFRGAYHGDTFGAMSFGGRSLFNRPFEPFLFETLFVEPPLPGKQAACMEELHRHLQRDDVAGIIVEPLILGAGGMLMYEPEALEAVFAACADRGILLIADEVMTGFGRTGQFFACGHVQTQPHIYCLSKGLTGGALALGATLCTETVFEAFNSQDRFKTFFHGHSFTGNPLACAAALASLDLLEKPECQAHIQRIIQRHGEFAPRLAAFSCISNVRQTGVVLAFDWKDPAGSKRIASLPRFVERFVMERRIVLRPLGDSLYVLPPYCMTDEQLGCVYDCLLELAAELQGCTWTGQHLEL